MKIQDRYAARCIGFFVFDVLMTIHRKIGYVGRLDLTAGTHRTLLCIMKSKKINFYENKIIFFKEKVKDCEKNLNALQPIFK